MVHTILEEGEHDCTCQSLPVLARWVADARQRTIDLVADLSDARMQVPKIDIVNPFAWEIGHAAYFQEHWVLHHYFGEPQVHADAADLWDSIGIAHDDRWDLPLPRRTAIMQYLLDVRDRLLAALSHAEPTPQLVYLVKLSVFHEDMHTEAFTYTRQTLGYPQPAFTTPLPEDVAGAVNGNRSAALPAPRDEDVEFAGGRFQFGAACDEPFVFDNEKWSHPASVAPFRISRYPVTQGKFAEFVDDGGYRERRVWSDAGWRWRLQQQAQCPAYWRSTGSGWERRCFDTWTPLEPDHPMVHANWFEAEAYCRWAGRRLPTEAEWEWAATQSAEGKRRFPWGDTQASACCQTDWREMNTAPVQAHDSADSWDGCRQMLGNVWEWTVSGFGPYPGFAPDCYREYSRPLFGITRVLRGGSWATRARMLRSTLRNYYGPDRRDIWAGFRTCSLYES